MAVTHSFMPSTLRRGETIYFTASFTGYSAADYTLEYYLQNSSNYYKITATQSETAATDWDVNITSGTSSGYGIGEYTYTARVTDGTVAYVVESGVVEVVAALDVAADRRSHAKKMLDAIEALLEGRATADVQSYTIQGRSLSKLTIPDLLKWRDRYRVEYQQELQRERLARGDGVSNSVKIRFV